MAKQPLKPRRARRKAKRTPVPPDPNDPIYQVAKKREAQTKERICLGCPREFISRGPGHRFCPVCTKKRAKSSGGKIYRVSENGHSSDD